MRKYLFKVSPLFLFALCLIFFSFKDRVYSKTDTSGISLESNPRGIAINPITDIAVVSNEKADSVSIVDLNTQTVLSTIPVGKEPKGVAIDNGLNLALVSNSHDNTVSIIDLNAFSVIKTISVGKEPEGIAVNPSNHTALVANHKDDTVSVIDLLNYIVIGTIPVGKEPKDVAIDPVLNSIQDQGFVLVVNEKDSPPFNSPLSKGGDEGGVAVIDLNTYQVTGEVPVGKKPRGNRHKSRDTPCSSCKRKG